MVSGAGLNLHKHTHNHRSIAVRAVLLLDALSRDGSRVLSTQNLLSFSSFPLLSQEKRLLKVLGGLNNYALRTCP